MAARTGSGAGERRPRRMWVSFVALTVLTAAALVLVTQERGGGAVLATRVGTVRMMAADTVPGLAHAHTAGMASTPMAHLRPVLVADDGHFYFLSGAERYPVGRRVTVTGSVGGSAITSATITATAGLAPAATSGLSTSGTTKVLVMLAYWTAPDSVTPQSAAAQMFGDSSDFYRDNSYGALGQTGAVTPWMRVDPPTDNHCYGDSDRIMGQAKSGAQAAGYDLAAYDNYVVYFPYDGDAGSDCSGYAGWAFVGAPGTWLNGYLDRRTSVHEEGHNYGLFHAHSLLCAGPIDPTCQFTEYGNDYDAMGSSGYVGHFSASQKSKLGWMDGRVQDLSAGGVTTLRPYESDAPGTIAAKVGVSPARSYWLEYRQAQDFDRDLPGTATDGVLVTVQDPNGPQVFDDGASLLDARPGDGLSVSTATIRSGESFRTEEGVVISVGGVSASGAELSVSRPAVGTISGTVRDGADRPLGSSVVRLDGGPRVTTGSDGRYTLTDVVAGQHTLRAEHMCLATGATTVTSSGGDSRVDFVLGTPAEPVCVLDTPVWDSPATALALTGDDDSVPVALPFGYRHFGRTYTTAYVATNGYLDFTGPGAVYENAPVPTAGEPDAALFAFWDDLNVDPAASVLTGTFGTAPNRRFVVEWHNVQFYGEGGRFTVQAVLYENPGQAPRFQYRDIDTGTLESGVGATIGAENDTGGAGLQASFNTGLVYDGLSLRLGGHRLPRVSIGDASVPEGDRASRAARFSVSLDRPAPVDVMVAYRTVDGTAKTGRDFTGRNGAVTIPAGALSVPLTVPVLGDRTDEPHERFTVELGSTVGAEVFRGSGVGRILDDDPSGARRIGVGDAAIVEGDDGVRVVRFTVSLSSAASRPVSVAYATAGGSASPGIDFVPVSGSVIVPAGATSKVVSVRVRPDTDVEGNESFTLRVSDVRGAAPGRTVGTGRVLDDD